MVDVMDTIYKQEAQKCDSNLENIKVNINNWAKANEEPKNPESSFIQRNWDIEENRKKKQMETLLDEEIDLDAETDA